MLSWMLCNDTARSPLVWIRSNDAVRLAGPMLTHHGCVAVVIYVVIFWNNKDDMYYQKKYKKVEEQIKINKLHVKHWIHCYFKESFQRPSTYLPMGVSVFAPGGVGAEWLTCMETFWSSSIISDPRLYIWFFMLLRWAWRVTSKEKGLKEVL